MVLDILPLREKDKWRRTDRFSDRNHKLSITAQEKISKKKLPQYDKGAACTSKCPVICLFDLTG